MPTEPFPCSRPSTRSWRCRRKAWFFPPSGQGVCQHRQLLRAAPPSPTASPSPLHTLRVLPTVGLREMGDCPAWVLALFPPRLVAASLEAVVPPATRPSWRTSSPPCSIFPLAWCSSHQNCAAPCKSLSQDSEVLLEGINGVPVFTGPHLPSGFPPRVPAPLPPSDPCSLSYLPWAPLRSLGHPPPAFSGLPRPSCGSQTTESGLRKLNSKTQLLVSAWASLVCSACLAPFCWSFFLTYQQQKRTRVSPPLFTSVDS